MGSQNEVREVAYKGYPFFLGGWVGPPPIVFYGTPTGDFKGKKGKSILRFRKTLTFCSEQNAEQNQAKF
jgi:hypothetical protein